MNHQGGRHRAVQSGPRTPTARRLVAALATSGATLLAIVGAAPPSLPDRPSAVPLVHHVDLVGPAGLLADAGARPALPSAGAPIPGIPVAQPISLRTVRSTVGQLQSRAGRQGRQCTATVVASRSKSVAVTAAHCVYLPASVAGTPQPAADRGWVDETEFIPGVEGSP